MEPIVSSDEAKVQDYSRYGDVNDYIGSLKGDVFRDYRRRWHLASSMEKEFDFPLFLVFETMFKCNLKCTMCLHSSAGKKKYGYDGKLSFDKYKEIIREASEYGCPSLTIGGTSEPLLDARIADMISFANKSGFVDTMLNTNATLLTEDVGKALIEAELTRLRIGFDGATAETYESIRVGAKYENVKENILNFIELRNKMKSQFPIVRLSFVNLAANNSELESYVDFWKTVADYVTIQRYKPHEFTEKRSWKLMGAGDSSIKNIKCSQPFERVYIRGNGDVHACCSVVYGPKVGNVFETSIYEIWNSKKMKELRKELKKGIIDKNPGCKKCMIESYGAEY